MNIQIRTASYSDRRYGKPWIAVVTFPNARGDSKFGDWIGTPGSDGLLEIDCQPGDIVAKGQKDFRKPKNSEPDYYIAQEDGSLTMVLKVEAYLHYKEVHKNVQL